MTEIVRSHRGSDRSPLNQLTNTWLKRDNQDREEDSCKATARFLQITL